MNKLSDHLSEEGRTLVEDKLWKIIEELQDMATHPALGFGVSADASQEAADFLSEFRKLVQRG